MGEESKSRRKKGLDFTPEELEKQFQAQLKIIAERKRLTEEKRKKKRKKK
jgi:hypothetical protein